MSSYKILGTELIKHKYSIITLHAHQNPFLFRYAFFHYHSPQTLIGASFFIFKSSLFNWLILSQVLMTHTIVYCIEEFNLSLNLFLPHTSKEMIFQYNAFEKPDKGLSSPNKYLNFQIPFF